MIDPAFQAAMNLADDLDRMALERQKRGLAAQAWELRQQAADIRDAAWRAHG